VELNRRTKLVGGILALAVAALIYDRFIAGGPASAEVAPMNSAASAPEAKPEPPAARPERPPNRGALSSKLAVMRAESNVSAPRDAFVAPAAWFPPPEVAVQDEPQPVAAAARVSTVHKISSVMFKDRAMKDVRFAVVDNQRLEVGCPRQSHRRGQESPHVRVGPCLDRSEHR
jgi:hypothetical protein